MSKSILVIDTPSCCEMCDLRCLSYWYGNDFCSASEEVDIDYTNYKTKRNEKCPLKPMPKKIEELSIEETIVSNMYKSTILLEKAIKKAKQRGYNECLDEILGEEE